MQMESWHQRPVHGHSGGAVRGRVLDVQRAAPQLTRPHCTLLQLQHPLLHSECK